MWYRPIQHHYLLPPLYIKGFLHWHGAINQYDLDKLVKHEPLSIKWPYSGSVLTQTSDHIMVWDMIWAMCTLHPVLMLSANIGKSPLRICGNNRCWVHGNTVSIEIICSCQFSTASLPLSVGAPSTALPRIISIMASFTDTSGALWNMAANCSLST